MQVSNKKYPPKQFVSAGEAELFFFGQNRVVAPITEAQVE